MRGKHVHFAPANDYFSPNGFAPIPLAPTRSRTPPPRGSGILRTRRSSVTDLHHHAKPPSVHLMRVHALLAAGPTYPINYDLTHHPATVSTHHPSLAGYSLSEPATDPPLPSLKVTSPHLPWVFHIHGSPSPRGTFVTVADVLSGLYRGLRANVKQEEFYSLLAQRERQRVSTAYKARYRAVPDPRMYAEEKHDGVKRVDFLMGHTRFLGLSSTAKGPDVWAMNVS